jgi:hypothetical protein
VCSFFVLVLFVVLCRVLFLDFFPVFLHFFALLLFRSDFSFYFSSAFSQPSFSRLSVNRRAADSLATSNLK